MTDSYFDKAIKGNEVIKLLKGDCLERMKEIESGSVDLILSDLPYGTMKGIESTGHYHASSDHDWDVVIDTNKIMNEANRMLRKNGKMLLFAQQPFTTELITSALPNLPYCYSMIWEKDHFANALTAKKAPLNYYEDVLVFSKRDPKNEVLIGDEVRDYFKSERLKLSVSLTEINRVAFGCKSGKDGMAGNILSSYKKGWTFPTKEKYESLNKAYGICNRSYENLKCIADKIRFDYINNESTLNPSTFNLWQGNKFKSNILKYKKDYDGYHSTQKPVLLLEDLIKTYSNEGDLVVDMTMGSGSTMVACKNTGRRGVGIELDRDYFNIAKKRVIEA